MKKVSIIIPVFNEENLIGDCLESLASQSYKETEIIVVDDGSTDKTAKIITNYKLQNKNLKLLQQYHQGPGVARNLGASKATGEILVFVDADMTFEKNFIKDLITPIISGKAIGTFSKNEMVSNPHNLWSVCWNINRNVPPDRMLPENYPNTAEVFRAIAKSEFDKVGGFETTGQYTDDWSLSKKLNTKSSVAKGALYYHQNPASLKEVFNQARWIGKNDFISGTPFKILKSLIIYNPFFTLISSVYKSFKFKNFLFPIFKFTYDTAILISIFKALTNEAKFK